MVTIEKTSDISYKGKFNWFNSEKTILDLDGCDNLVNSSFVKHHLRLDIQTDTSLAAQDIQRSVNGDTFTSLLLLIYMYIATLKDTGKRYVSI